MSKHDLSGPAPQPTTLAEAQQLIEVLWKELCDLRSRLELAEEQLALDSGSSSKPPSTDSPAQRAKRRKQRRSGRSQGAQPGHPKHERALVPLEDVDRVERFYPNAHCACGQVLAVEDEPAVRHQVFDVPEVRYQVTEYQLYRGYCGACDQHTRAALPDWVPHGQMGPGLLGWIGVLAGQFHLSVRKIQQFLHEQWSLPFSIGAISQAQGKLNAWLLPIHQQIGAHVRQAEVAHADETTHYRYHERHWLWCLTTPIAVYLVTHYSRGKMAALELLCPCPAIDSVGESQLTDGINYF